MDSDKAGSSNSKFWTRRELFQMVQEQNLSNINEKLDFIENYLLSYDDYTEDETKEIKHNCRRLRSEF
ncbi:unnamed protein product, partial [Callosobruchus maculatus]